MSAMAVATFTTVITLIVVYAIFVIWVSIGGAFDLRAMFRDLQQERIDVRDDGFVRDANGATKSVEISR